MGGIPSILMATSATAVEIRIERVLCGFQLAWWWRAALQLQAHATFAWIDFLAKYPRVLAVATRRQGTGAADASFLVGRKESGGVPVGDRRCRIFANPSAVSHALKIQQQKYHAHKKSTLTSTRTKAQY